MKQLFTLGFVLTSFSLAYAQTEQGQALTGGSVGLSLNIGRLGFDQTSIPGDVKNNGYGVNVTINRGHFVRDNWLLQYSLGGGYSQAQGKANAYDVVGDITKQYSINASVGVGLRRYWPLVDKLYVYAGGGVAAAMNQSRQLFYGVVIEDWGRSATFRNWIINPTGQLGALYVLSKRVAAEINLTGNVVPISSSNVSFGVVLLSANQDESNETSEATSAPQTRQGRWLPGVSVNVAGASNEQEGQNGMVSTTSSSSARTNLSIGHFVRDNLLIGVGAGYETSRAGSRAQPGIPGYSLNLDAFVRSYIGVGRLCPFIQAGLSYGYEERPATLTPKTIGLNASGGLTYLLGDRFIIQSTIGAFGATYQWLSIPPTGGRYSQIDLQANATTFSNFAVYYAL